MITEGKRYISDMKRRVGRNRKIFRIKMKLFKRIWKLVKWKGNLDFREEGPAGVSVDIEKEEGR